MASDGEADEDGGNSDGEGDVDSGKSDGESDVDGGNSDGEADVDSGNSDGDVDVDGGNSDGDSDQDSDGHNAGSKLPPIKKEVQLISMKIAHELLRMCLNQLCKYFTISPFRIHESIFLSWFFQLYKFIKKLLTCIDENSSAILTVIIHNQINK